MSKPLKCTGCGIELTMSNSDVVAEGAVTCTEGYFMFSDTICKVCGALNSFSVELSESAYLRMRDE